MNLPPLNYLANLVTHRRRAAVLVLLTVLAGWLFLLPRPSLTAGTDEPQQTRRRGAGAVAKGSKRLFIHDKNHIRSSKENGRLVSNCAECHRIPGAFYVSENAQGFNVREFPDHPDCLRCHEHRKDFFKGATPPICTVCHKGSSPREGNPGLFPKAGGPDVERDFTGRFPHDKHQDILAQNESPARANAGFRIVKAGFSTQDNKAKSPTRWDCRRCHLPYPTEVEKQLLANVDWAGAKLPLFADDQKKLYTDSDKKVPLLSNINLPIGMKPDETDPTAPAGTFRQSPNGPTGHKYCFECHALTQGAWNSPFPRANDCVGCHGQGRALEPAKPEGAGVVKTITPLNLTAAGRLAVADPALRQKSGLLEIPPLPPRISYKFQHDIEAHTVVECTVCHINITRQQNLSVANPDVPMSSCALCHANSKGSNINITKEPVLALKLDDELEKRRANPQYTCVACHTPDTGRNPPPDSHYSAVGKTRINF